MCQLIPIMDRMGLTLAPWRSRNPESMARETKKGGREKNNHQEFTELDIGYRNDQTLIVCKTQDPTA